jgi:CrcB protein
VSIILVLLGGAVGAPARYLADRYVSARHDSVLPWGTFTVNIAGSFVLGLVASLVVHRGAPDWLLTLVGTGFCGALTTYSTFSYETIRLVEDGSWRQAAVNVGGSVTVGFVACVGGWLLGGVTPQRSVVEPPRQSQVVCGAAAGAKPRAQRCRPPDETGRTGLPCAVGGRHRDVPRNRQE